MPVTMNWPRMSVSLSTTKTWFRPSYPSRSFDVEMSRCASGFTRCVHDSPGKRAEKMK